MTKSLFSFNAPLWLPDGMFRQASQRPQPVLSTQYGVLFKGDCLELLPALRDESTDTIFCDPPFNLGKTYGGKVDDNRPDDEYVA